MAHRFPDETAFLEGFAWLLANFRASTSDLTGEALEQAWRAALCQPVWLTADVFSRAVVRVLASGRPYLPTVGEFLGYCEVAERELQREAEAAEAAQAATPALPAPVTRNLLPDGRRVDPDTGELLDVRQPPRGYDRAEWNRNVALGKARQRRRNAAAVAWRQEQSRLLGRHLEPDTPVPPHVTRAAGKPTEGEVEAVLAEMARGQVGSGPLAGALFGGGRR